VLKSQESEVAEEFLDQADERSFNALFRVFAPQVVAFFQKRGHERDVAEDLTQEVMLTVYRKAGQLRDHRLFRAWLFKIARHTACRYFAQRTRQVPTVDLAEMTELLPALNHGPCGPASEFAEWMKFLEPHEREAMTLRFVEEWEYHEIAAAQAIPIGTAQWRVFNSKKKLSVHLSPRYEPARNAA
jgi:RNA polymerase sigma-70 factor (ECF subfamily)